MPVGDPAGNDNPRLALDDEDVSGLAAQWLVRSEKRDLGGVLKPVVEPQFRREKNSNSRGQPHRRTKTVAFLRASRTYER